MVSFKGAQYPKDVILFAVFFYVRYGVSYRDLEEIMGERGVQVDHTTLNRWVIRYSGVIAEAARHRKERCDRSWRMDETYICLLYTSPSPRDGLLSRMPSSA